MAAFFTKHSSILEVCLQVVRCISVENIRQRETWRNFWLGATNELLAMTLKLQAAAPLQIIFLPQRKTFLLTQWKMWHNQSSECANCIFLQLKEDLEVNTLPSLLPSALDFLQSRPPLSTKGLAGNAIMAFRRVALGCYDEEYYEEIMRRYYAPIRKFCVKVGFCWSFKNWSKLWWRSAKEISTFIPSSCQIITIWKGSVTPVTCLAWFIAGHARAQKCPIIDP